MSITREIARLKREKNAVILAHNYQPPEIQDTADILGDSLGLSVSASETDADIIVFCGVLFMAETAKIVSPEKKVLIPEPDAGCPMADMADPEKLSEVKRRHTEAKTMCYVNSSAEIKAESDICCTSANALQIAEGYFPADQEVIFLPDYNLAENTAKRANRDFIKWEGFCPTHENLSIKSVDKAREMHPEAEVLVHPETPPDIAEAADKVLSTGGMIEYARGSQVKEFVIGTERDMVYRLKREIPEKEFFPLYDSMTCIDMKKNTLEKVYASLKEEKTEVEIDEGIRRGAERSIRRMMDFKGEVNNR
ncbi:MAG: quinolinate synthase NadA [Chitinivibrionales bacterium]